jgi:glycosyltransferase involved in cell wall biosynthesis
MSGLRRVGLNLLFLVPGETGGSEIYVRNLLPRLAEARPDLELVAFVNREGAGLDLGGIETVPVGVSGRGRARRVLAEQVHLPRLGRRHGIDLLHSPGTSAPRRPGVVSVVTILDVIYASHPEAHTLPMRLGMRVVVPLAARGADRVITISRAAAGEIADELGVPPERIDVTYLGGRPVGPATPEGELRRRLGLGDAPLVLSVSARRPHKNLLRLVEAFAAVTAEPAPLLVVPGYETPFEDEIRARAVALGVEERVRFLGWMGDEDLEGLYAASTCFVFPSLAEGFGLPVLEAMQRGLPVACSRASSLPEVAGEAARYFDPLDVADITAALSELLWDAALRDRLAAAGRTQTERFSWERTARETGESYDRAWAERRPAAR